MSPCMSGDIISRIISRDRTQSADRIRSEILWTQDWHSVKVLRQHILNGVHHLTKVQELGLDSSQFACLPAIPTVEDSAIERFYRIVHAVVLDVVSQRF